MAITAKPFTASEKIVRSIFAGDPSIFSAQDLNRQFDVNYAAIKQIQESVGLVRDGWDCEFTMVDAGGAGITHQYNIVADGSGNSPVLYSKGVAFAIPLGSVSETGFDPEVNSALWLIATKTLVTFDANPTMSGINSTEHPTSMPSSDTYVWGDERLEVTAADATPSLGAGEEVIGVLVSEMANYYQTERPNFRHNAAKFTDMLTELKLPADFVAANNATVIDVLNAIIRKLKLLGRLASGTVTLKNDFTTATGTMAPGIKSLNGFGKFTGGIHGVVSTIEREVLVVSQTFHPEVAISGFIQLYDEFLAEYKTIRYTLDTSGRLYLRHYFELGWYTGIVNLDDITPYILKQAD